MKKVSIGKIVTGILMIFIFSSILPSCATTNVSESDTTRQSLMMMERSGNKAKKHKATRWYKKSKKRENQFKNKKHKYKKSNSRRRSRRR